LKCLGSISPRLPWGRGAPICRGKILKGELATSRPRGIELPPQRYNVVLNFNYLQRSLVPQIKKSLKPGGWVIFETYLIDQQSIGEPKNLDYLLLHNELLNLFRDFRVLARGCWLPREVRTSFDIVRSPGRNARVTLDGPRIEVDPGSDALAVLLDDRHSFAPESAAPHIHPKFQESAVAR
jgi:hypothetical protein